MKKSRIFVALLLVVLVSALAFSQTAADVVKRAIAASGDFTKIQNASSMLMKMKGDMAGREMNMEVISMGAEKMHMKMDMMGMTTKVTINGDDAWMDMMGRIMDLPMDKAAQNRSMTQGFDGSYLKLIAESEAAYVGVKDFNGVQCDVLKGKDPNAQVEAEYYFDKGTGLMVGMKTEAVETYMYDYKDVQGVKIPHKIKMVMNGNMTSEITITEIKFNPPVDASLFERK